MTTKPVPMILRCPYCWTVHIDEGEWATRPHRTHKCEHCGETWRPANIATVGVRELPDEDGAAAVTEVTAVRRTCEWASDPDYGHGPTHETCSELATHTTCDPTGAVVCALHITCWCSKLLKDKP